MSDITLDIFTVILLVIIAFMFGIEAGKRIHKEETRRNVVHFIKAMTTSLSSESDKKKREEEAKKTTDRADEFWKLVISENDGKASWNKEEKGENDQK